MTESGNGDNVNDIFYFAAWSNFAICGCLLLVTLYVLKTIRRGGNWLTLGASYFIAVAQVCNMGLTLIIVYQGVD